jgi:hypothetical protein
MEKAGKLPGFLFAWASKTVAYRTPFTHENIY